MHEKTLQRYKADLWNCNMCWEGEFMIHIITPPDPPLLTQLQCSWLKLWVEQQQWVWHYKSVSVLAGLPDKTPHYTNMTNCVGWRPAHASHTQKKVSTAIFCIREFSNTHNCLGWEGNASPPTQRAQPISLIWIPSHGWLWHWIPDDRLSIFLLLYSGACFRLWPGTLACWLLAVNHSSSICLIIRDNNDSMVNFVC